MRVLLAVLMLSASCLAQTWGTWNGKTVGGSAGNISSMNGKTIGTASTNYNKWNNLNSPSGGGGGFALVASGGADASCRGFGGSTFTCVKDTTPGISTGNFVCIMVTYAGGDTPGFAGGGGGTFGTIATGDWNFSTSLGRLACSIATGSATSVQVTGLTGGSFVRIRWGAFSGVSSATKNGSQGSGYFVAGTTIDTGSSFSITANSLVVAGVYGVNGSVAGGITPAAGWTPTTVGWTSGGCDTDGGAFLCMIYRTESGTSTNPSATQTSDTRLAAGGGFQ
jgi:hypothetical protein